MSYKQQMTSTIVEVIWADFGSISTRLKHNLLIFNLCGADETRKLLEAIIVRTW